MRRGLASLILILALLIASGSWAGFVMTRTVLDPGRSEALADNLLENTVVRGVIIDRLSDAVEAQIPPAVPIPRQTIEVAAEEALDDPRVEAVVRDGFVLAHQNALNGIDEPVMLDASALGQVGREKAVAIRPELDAVLPAAPRVEVELPTGGLAVFGTLRDRIQRYTLIGAIIAAVGVSLAFGLTTKRAKALRRVSYWAFANSAFWLLVGYGVPALLERAAPASVSISTAVVDVFFGAMIRPALLMFVFGLVLLGISLAWPALARRRPAGLVDQQAPVPGALHQPRPVLEGFAPMPSQQGPAPAGAAYTHDPGPGGYDRYSLAEPQHTPAGFDPYGNPIPVGDPHPHTDPQTHAAPTAAGGHHPYTAPAPDPYTAPAADPTAPYPTAAPDPYAAPLPHSAAAHTAGAHTAAAHTAAAPDPSVPAQPPYQPRADDPETWTMDDHEAQTQVWSRHDDFGQGPTDPENR